MPRPEPIRDNGYAGQIVVLDVKFEPDPLNPLAKYPQPSFFEIMERVEGENRKYYLLRDADKEIPVPFGFVGSGSELFLDARAWARWMTQCHNEEIAARNKKIIELEEKLEMLKDILIKQGSGKFPQELTQSDRGGGRIPTPSSTDILGEKLWRKMNYTRREQLLEKLASEFNRGVGWWNGLTISEIARIVSFDDLPGDLRGLLIAAITAEGFSVDEAIAIYKKFKPLLK